MMSRRKGRTKSTCFLSCSAQITSFASFITDRMSLRLSSLDNEELIHDAVLRDYLLALEIHLNENPQSINKFFRRNRCHWTPLIAACFFKHEAIVRMLLRRFKPDVEAKGTIVLDESTNDPEIFEDVPALWTATVVDHFGIVRLLVEHGRANVNHLTKTHSTALRVACYNNNMEMVEYLVAHGADPYQSKLGNYTNLMLSAGRGHFHLVVYLIEQLKCDLNERDENGQVALYYAVRSGCEEIVRYLLARGALNLRDTLKKITPLMRAALFGQVELVEAFHGKCTDLEWIEGKELLAANFAGWIPKLENLHRTIQYLTEAFALRKLNNLPKTPLEQTSILFAHRTECATLEEFTELISADYPDALRVETIRIHQRLLGDQSEDYHYVLHSYGIKLANDSRYVECAQWWLYEFELEQKHGIQIERDDLRRLLGVLTEVELNRSPKISLDTLQRTLTVIDGEVRSQTGEDRLDDTLLSLLFVIKIVAQRLDDEGDSRATDDLHRSIRSIVARQYRTKETKSSLLHLCCNALTPALEGDPGRYEPRTRTSILTDRFL